MATTVATTTTTTAIGNGSVLTLNFATRINLSYQPGAERRFSIHLFLSNRLEAIAMRKRNSKHHCHHASPAVHVIHIPEMLKASDGTGSEGGTDIPLPQCGVLKLNVALNGLRWRLGRGASNDTLLESTLNVDLYDHIKNSGGEDCFNQVGSARIPLVQLVAQTHLADIMRYDLIVPGMRSKHYAKGVISVMPSSSSSSNGGVASRVSINGVPTIVQVDNKAVLDAMVQRALQSNNALFEEHMMRWIDFFQSGQVQTRFKCTEGINVWRYDNRVDIGPFEKFIGAPLPPPNLAFHEAALTTVLARYGVTSAAQWLERANLDDEKRDSFAERILCEVITLFVCVLNYIPDEVHANTSSIAKGRGKRVVLTLELIESFDFCRVRRALDCEDSALEICWQFYELHVLYRDQYDKMTPALRRLVEVAHCYHAMLWLVGVSGAEINEEKMSDVDEMDAHMHTALVPKAMWVEWCRRGKVPMSDERLMPFNSAAWGDSPLAYERSKHCRGVMINEGTGFLEPTGDDDDTLDMRTILYKLLQHNMGPAFELARKVYGFKRGEPSGFYKLLVGCYTPAFLLRGGLACGFVPCYRDDLSKYVVRFQDVTADAERQTIAVRMLPPISRQTWQEVQRTSNDLYPVGPLELAYARVDEEAEWIATARANVQSAENALRRLANTSSRRQQQRATTTTQPPVALTMRVPVVYYLKYEACTVDALQALVNGVATVFDCSDSSMPPARTVISIEASSTGNDDGAQKQPKQVERRDMEFTFYLAAVDMREERVSTDLGAFRVQLDVVAMAQPANV